MFCNYNFFGNFLHDFNEFFIPHKYISDSIPFFLHIRLIIFFFSFTAHKYSHNHSNTHQFTYKTNKCGRHRSHKGYWIDLKTHFDTQFDNFIFQWNTFYNFSRYVFDDHRVRSKKNSAVKSNETAKIWRWRACQLPPYCYCYICSDNSVRMTDVKLPFDYLIFEILPVWQFFWNYFTFWMW